MNPICRKRLNEVRAQSGRAELTDAQVAKIEGRMKESASVLQQRDPAAWRSLTAEQKALAAAQKAAEDIAAEAARKVDLARKQVLATAAIEARASQMMPTMKMTRAEFWADEIQKADDEAIAIARQYRAALMEALEAAESREGASLVRQIGMLTLRMDNPAMTRDIANEIHSFGKAGTGNKLAVAAARVFHQVNESMRKQFNSAGGDVGRLDYGYMPNAWEPDLVLRAGPDRFAEANLPRVDRRKYLNEDGSRMTDEQVLSFLRAAAETIGSNGANKVEPGQFRGAGARANRGSEHRQIHWKDGAAYVEAMSQFGTGSMYDALLGHVQMMARDIALLERFGPNPNAQHRLQRDLAAAQTPGRRAPLVAWSDLDHHWATLAGTQVAQWSYTPPVIGAAIERVTLGKISGTFTGGGAARFWQHARNIQVFSKLGGALLSSFTDLPTYFLNVHFNKLPAFQAFTNIPRAMTPGARRELVEFMNTQGLVADTLINNINRFTGDHVAANWSGRLSDATMRVSFMNWWTDGLRRAFSLTMQQGMAKWAKTEWSQLDQWTRDVLLGSRGITEADWNVIRSAQPVQTQWGDIITPESIYATGDENAQQVAKRYLAVLSHESTMAVIEPDIAARAVLRRGSSPGTVGGESLRTIGQFKAFPVALFTRIYKRLLYTPTGLEGAPLGFQSEGAHHRLATMGAFIVAMTALGALSFQAKQIAQGKDPVDMTTEKFWLRAMAQGGGLGFLGDVVLRDSTDDMSGQQGLFELLGPVPGSMAQVYDLTKRNIDQFNAGKETNAGAEGIRFVRSHAPLVNLWYARAAIDRAGLHALQETLNPGYLAKMKRRAQKDWNGQEFWWEPGTGLPDRAPDLSAIAGP